MSWRSLSVPFAVSIGVGSSPVVKKQSWERQYKVGQKVEYCWFGEWLSDVITKIDPSKSLPFHVGTEGRLVGSRHIRLPKSMSSQPEEPEDYSVPQEILDFIDSHWDSEMVPGSFAGAHFQCWHRKRVKNIRIFLKRHPQVYWQAKETTRKITVEEKNKMMA